MDIDNVLTNLKTLSFKEVEQYSQDCSKQVIFDMLDKTKDHKPDMNYFEKCQSILAEYRQRLGEIVKKDSGIDIEQHKAGADKESH